MTSASPLELVVAVAGRVPAPSWVRVIVCVVDEVAGEPDAEGDGAVGGDGAADRVGEGAGAGTAGVELEPFADGDREASLLEDGAEDGVGAAGVEVDGELELVGAELARASGEAEEAVARRLGGDAREPVAERDRGAGVAAPEDDLGADLEEVVAVAGESGCVLDRGDLDVDARAGEVRAAGQRPFVAARLGLLDREGGQVDGARDPDHVAEGSAGEVGAEAALELAAGHRGCGVGGGVAVECAGGVEEAAVGGCERVAVFLQVGEPGEPFAEGELEEVEPGRRPGDLQALADRARPPVPERDEDRRAGIAAR